MNSEQARTLVTETFPKEFDKNRFRNFVINLLNKIDESKAQVWSSTYIKNAFKDHVSRYERLGTYTSPESDKLDVLIVHLTAESKIERARTAIRNFVADHLKTPDGKDAALVAFVSPNSQQWRFSYVKMEYEASEKKDGSVGIKSKLTPARRSSYIVGEGESCHTAQSRFLDLLQDTENHPSLQQIEESFSVEAVTREFFEQYKALFLDLKDELDELAKKEKTVQKEFSTKKVSTENFSKKLMGQIVFLYFLQKKGWLGVRKNGNWGDGPHNFLRQLFNGKFGVHKNFFNDILEPLFYDTLATDRGHEAWCKPFNCRIPFLNGGLFEPLAGYNWQETDIVIPNSLFSNTKTTSNGDTGTGILDVFDRYNFTVNEAEPLEKEVAIDPEMLGKVFENLLEVKERKSKGSYYTPREIVHYMCQESLINYLNSAVNMSEELIIPSKVTQTTFLGNPEPMQVNLKTNLNREVIPLADIESFIHSGDQASHYEAARLDGTSYQRKLPKTIESHARLLDDKLAEIAVCDPAIGSGAFPVGMMQEIVRARYALTPYFNDVLDRTAYHFKRHAIQNCLYGVDIDPGAVEIAKLRLWLSLVVDEEDLKQIKPLPNLDYKVVTGNSLLGVEKNLFNVDLFNRLEELKPSYFDATDQKKKDKYKQEIDELIYKLTSSKEAFDFEIYFSEIFHKKNGFDVVIGNPPYGFRQIHSDSSKVYFKENYSSAHGSYENYFLFYEKSLKLLNRGGIHAFIAPVTWLTIPSAKALRQFILTGFSIMEISWLSEEAFENASVNTLTSFIQRVEASKVKIKIFGTLDEFPLNPLSQQEILQKQFRDNDDYISIFSNPNETAILEKVREVSKPLVDYANPCSGYNPYEIGAGVAPGGGVHTKQTIRDKPYHSDKKRGDEWKPEIIGRDLTRYSLKITGDRWVKYGPWLAAQRDPDNFNGKRILVQEITGGRERRIVAAYYEGELYHSRDVIPIKLNSEIAHPYYLLGVINSWLISWYHKMCNPKAQKGLFPKVLVSDLKKLPIYPPSKKSEQQKIISLVGRVITSKQRDSGADVTSIEREIDEMVYALYGLTKQDIAIVEESRN